MRNNIVFYGISEFVKADCRTTILNFLQDEMHIDTSNMIIQRAHRLGQLRSTQNTRDQRYDMRRPVIACFMDYNNTELILSKARSLKGTPFGVDRQYPTEISQNRKALYDSPEA